MENECDSLTSGHRITLDRLTCSKNQSIKQEYSQWMQRLEINWEIKERTNTFLISHFQVLLIQL